LDTPMTYEAMRASGSIMGSGGLIVMDESTCMVELARYFIHFASDESCGNCTPCRIGTRILKDTLQKIIQGEGETQDLETIRHTAYTMANASLCGLGQAASNPVTSGLRYFLSEYQAHIQDKYCPAAVCEGLFKYWIEPARCSGCHLCTPVCPSGAIQGSLKEIHVLDQDLCIACGACVTACARNAIKGIPVNADSVSQISNEVAL
jgi:NADP-reducing hydrogenase subunit HndC